MSLLTQFSLSCHCSNLFTVHEKLTSNPSCDACRKRKICCTRDAYEKDCSLCKTRGESCKYVLPPNVRRNRQPGAVPTPIARSRTSSSSTTSIPPRPVVPRGTRSGDGSVGEWICQFVGLSGDQDPWVLRHCSFNALNYYKAPDWAVLRIKGYGDTPLQFTVCRNFSPFLKSSRRCFGT